MVADEELEGSAAKIMEENDGRMHQREVDIVKHSRATRNALIVGGKLYVTIQGVNGKQTWTGVVLSTDSK